MTALAGSAERLEHEHNDDECVPCLRCHHLACEHYEFNHLGCGHDDCEATGCECPAWLAYGTGGWWVESPDGRHEAWIICDLCDGTGVYHYQPPAVRS